MSGFEQFKSRAVKNLHRLYSFRPETLERPKLRNIMKARKSFVLVINVENLMKNCGDLRNFEVENCAKFLIDVQRIRMAFTLAY